MAVTKLLQIKRSHKEALEYIMDFTKTNAERNEQQDAIDYITNDIKTESGELVSGYNCDPKFSVAEFAMTQEIAREVKGNYRKVGGADIKAHHLIQSFSPEDNITPAEAHEIGKKLMQEFLGGQHEYVIATHIDKEHIHNHIVFNATSFYNHKKFRSVPYKTAAQIRSISDKLCAEHGLSVLKENQALKSNYQQYQKYRSQTTYRVQLRKRLNFLLETETDFSQFVEKANELDIVMSFDGKHAVYKYGDQKRNTRGDKLSDDGRFSKEGIQERLDRNKVLVNILESALYDAFNESSSLEDFELKLKENSNIHFKRNRYGKAVYHFNDEDQSTLSEKALNPGLTLEKIQICLRKGSQLVEEENHTSIKEEYEKTVQTLAQEIDSPVTVDSKVIKKVTDNGILLSVDRSADEKGFIFIDANHIDFLQKQDKYQIHLGDQYNYYFMDAEGKQTNYFIKGERLLRQLETKMNVPMIEVPIPPKNIKSISEKGMNLSFPDTKVDRMFIPKENVRYDSLSKKVSILVSNNWNYYFQSEYQETDQRKAAYQSMKGAELIEFVNNQRPTLDAALAYKLNALDKNIALTKTKNLAKQLSLLRTNNIKDVPDLFAKISDLESQIQTTKTSMDQLKVKIQEFNTVAKYLLMYQTNFDKYQEAKNSFFFQPHSAETNRKEVEAFQFAEKELDARGINPHVDYQKVLILIKQNEKQESSLKNNLLELEEELTNFGEVKSLIQELDQSNEKTRKTELEK